ncbi:MAG: bifunctional hydroxymethylpyrimidine kinase/phosphomethylpyrimidine kinase [Verrucomicrobia bacterium]|nr:MAG: bifunctional hydroxymethylpyrimidine kinase/phosphomethylpyrimidine kinase [Verrucomicrobiota bacterium]
MSSYSFIKPCVLTIGGSDCSCGAGIQADLKTISSQGGYGLTALTCVVAEVPDQVAEIKPLPLSLIVRQIELLFEAFPIKAIKTGLLYSSAIVKAVAKTLTHFSATQKVPLVVDPVMNASTGTTLINSPIVSAYQKHLIPLTTVMTPNLDELSAFSNRTITTYADMRRAGHELAKKWGIALLLKGGHLRDNMARDLLVTSSESEWEYASPFQPESSLHGTGCTFSAAIATYLALGNPLEQAVGIAKDFMDLVISSHLDWKRTKALEHFPNH